MKNIKFIYIVVFLLVSFLIYKSWFSLELITGGDFWPYAKSLYETKPLFLYLWDLNSAGGMGGFVGSLLWIYLNFGLSITVFGKFLGLDWILVERVFYFFPFLLISLFSSYKLFTEVFSKNIFSFLSVFVFCFNTYILMVVGGGQVAGIAMAYASSPLVFYTFINIFNNLDNNHIKIIRFSIISSLILSVQIIFDLRIAYITLFAVFVLWILKVFENKNVNFFLKSILFIFIIPSILTFLLNAFWIIPTIANGRNPVEQLGPAYSSLEAVKFFSFAKLENVFGLLHPNWPQNIFGKVGFMKAEFLFLPLLAYSSLIFIKKESLEKRKYIMFFIVLGLLGVFLAKGASEPFGQIYLWMFTYIPGFNMFRDPTKWYTLVAVSYSILIPFTVWKVYEWLKTYNKFSIFNFQFSIKSKIFNTSNLFLLIIVFYLLYLIRPAILGQLTGTFKSTEIPNEYIVLEKYLVSQDRFFRTLWYPTKQRFGFYSNSHPAIPAQDLFRTVNNKDLIKNLQNEGAEKNLQEIGVKYVIVPYDSQGEIFLKDRKYDEKTYLDTIKNISKIEWLKRVDGFGRIAVFEVSSSKDHFYISNQQSAISNQKITYRYVSPVEYVVTVENAKKGDTIVFAENYSASWLARNVDNAPYDWPRLIGSNPYNRTLNSFTLREGGNYSLVIYYYPQLLLNKAMFISFVTLIVLIFVLIVGLRLKKW